MRKLKTFENFNDNSIDVEMFPELNQSLVHDVTKYVDDILNGDKFSQLFDLLKIDVPNDLHGEEFDKEFDVVRVEAIKHFTKNPEQMVDREVDITNMKVDGGDGIPRVTNIGGVINEDKYDDEFNFGDEDEEVEIELNDAILALLEDSVNTSDLKTRKEFINAYLRDESGEIDIIGLVNDSDVYEFYLKYINGIDEVLVNSNYFDESPSSLGVFGVYDYIVHSTKFAVRDIVGNL